MNSFSRTDIPFAVTTSAEPSRVIIVGGGPAGARAAQDLLRLTRHDVTLLSDERWPSYNRVRLTPFLAGEVQIGQVYQPLVTPEDAPLRLYLNRRVVGIDRTKKIVTDQTGRRWGYDKLILATGSRPRVPNVPGIDCPGVFVFRNLDHAEKLLARSIRSRDVVVLGGGLLGLEAARGLARRGARITIIEHENRLMARQLDERAGALLKTRVEALGITVLVSTAVREIVGDSRVVGVRIGEHFIPCDTLIACTGTQPNMELARDAGLRVHRGIAVDAQMVTSDPDIYAVGECAEFNGVTYGLVAPGLEQAAVAAAHIATGRGAYAGSAPTSKLKVLGIPVFSVGDVERLEGRVGARSEVYSGANGYRRIVLQRGRLVGALAVGEWPGLNRVQDAVARGAWMAPWHIRRFRTRGEPWSAGPDAAADLPATATICNCTGVTRGQIGTAIAAGCTTIEEVQQRTSASSVCGSCRPLVQELLGAPPVRAPADGWRALLGAAAIAFALLAVIPAGTLPLSGTMQPEIAFDRLWTDGVAKQISGFVLAGIAVAAAALSLRKRWRPIRFGRYASWRIVHASLGVAGLCGLVLHTGMQSGENLNQWLLIDFLFVSALGAAAGAATALEHRVPAHSARPARTAAAWLHILATWPLPLLVLFHVVTVYFF